MNVFSLSYRIVSFAVNIDREDVCDLVLDKESVIEFDLAVMNQV